MATNPTLLSMPLAKNGQKNTIPTTQATAGNGLFSQSTGFPTETSLPLGAGGVAPSREDFNGVANLLGGVAFMAQKGFTFNYDATQDYYTGCIVIDPTDGKRYECIADMAAGTVAPSADTGNTYWKLNDFAPINSPAFTGTPTAPTPTSSDNSTKIATTAFVKTTIGNNANTSLSNLTTTGENHFLGSNNFTIIYPNGGTEANPASVTKNTRYVESNPFPGYIVNCVAEVLYNNNWGAACWDGASGVSNTGYGVSVNQINNDNIVVQTGATGVIVSSAAQGNPLAYPTNSGTEASLPCRVRVWKIGKV